MIAQLRKCLAALLALAISVAPFSAALADVAAKPAHASMQQGSGVGADPASGQASHASTKSARTSAHCNPAGKGSADTGSETSIPAQRCPCKDHGKACPHAFCPAKCYQLASVILPPQALAVVKTPGVAPSRVASPADWRTSPQPPPPRA